MAELDDILGAVLDEKYRLEKLLGKGGMGAVYLATHLGTERPVAVKLMAPRLTQNDEFVRRFSREAKAAGRLRHPNVVDVTDFGVARTERGPLAYLVMEYLDGCTLADILAEEKQLPLEWVTDILSQTASAVQEAHQLGIVHRDLKPDNIWLEPNRLGGYRVKVLDFGLAKLAEVAPRNQGNTSLGGNNNATTELRHSLPDAATILGDEFLPTLDGNAITLEENAPTAEHPLSKPPTISGTAGAVVEEPAAKAFAAAAGADDEAPTIALPANPDVAHLAAEEADTIALPPSDNDAEADTQELSAAAVAMQVASMLERRPTPFTTRHQSDDAHSTALDGNVTRVGSIIGTPLYMSPEQCRGDKLGIGTDIYSLGVITYQMLAGETPFSGNSLEILRQHREVNPVSLREKDKKVPRKIGKLVMSALEKDPARRPASVEAFANMFLARAEGVATLLQKAVSIYGERFASLTKISLLVHLPLLFFTLLAFGKDILLRGGHIGETAAQVFTGAYGFINFITNFISAPLISGVTVLIVLQLSVAPLRPIQGRAALKKVWANLRPLLWTGFLVITLGVLLFGAICAVGIPLGLLLKAKVAGALGTIVMILTVVAGLFAFAVIMVRSSLYAPIVLVEGLKGRAAMRRSKHLVSFALGTVIMTVAVQWLIPISISTGAQLIAASGGNNQPKVIKTNAGVKVEVGEQPTAADTEEEVPLTPEEKAARRKSRAYRGEVAGRLASLLSVFFVPLIAIINALLYMKLRQTAGESNKELFASFENEEMPTSRWQQTMRIRLSAATTSYRSSAKPSSASGSTPASR